MNKIEIAKTVATYAHQIGVDTGDNKPFELRPVNIVVREVRDPLDEHFPLTYEAEALDGAFRGLCLNMGSETADEAIQTLEIAMHATARWPEATDRIFRRHHP